MTTQGTVALDQSRYSYSQLEQLWERAGGSSVTAPLAAAIAMAESSGNASAVNHDSNGTVDRGLWQISSVHGAQSTFDPLANAQAAVNISGNGTNFDPWTTYKTGAYKQYLSGGGGSSSGGAGQGQPQLTQADLPSASMDQLITARMEQFAVKNPQQFGFTASGVTLTAATSQVGSKYTKGYPGLGLLNPGRRIIGFPGFLGIGSMTLLDAFEARMILGALAIGVGVVLFGAGLVLVAMAAGSGSGKVATMIEKVPGVQMVAGTVAKAAPVAMAA